MVTGAGDELEAAGHGHLRASHADREQVIDTLKAAFVQGRLAKGEFDLRVGQTFASRTYAAPCGGGLVLLHHAGGDAPAFADRDALGLAQARISPLRCRFAAVRPGVLGQPLGLRSLLLQ